MGLLLSILFSYVGACELMFVVRDIVHQVGLHHEKMKFNRNLSKATSSLHGLQDDLRKSIKSAQESLCERDSIHSMADGVQYEQGYRILPADEQDVEQRWMEARASRTTEPSHRIEANDVKNSMPTCINSNEEQHENNSQHKQRSRRSAETIVQNTKINEPIDSDVANDTNHLHGNDNDVPNIHFDEYSQDYLHALDDVKKKGQRKNDEQRRRKSYKPYATTVVQGNTTDTMQRRRSEDIDGETDNPWGELRPESFGHDDSLWSRERAMSIAEHEEMMGSNNEKLTHKRDTKPLNSTSPATADLDDEVNESDDAQETDVSNEIQCILPDSFDEKDAASDVRGNIELQRSVPEILVIGSDMDEIVEDGKMGEFIDYIEGIDNDDSIVTDKLQFKEFLDQPKRLRHSSYNYADDKDNEEKVDDLSTAGCDESSDEKQSNDFHSKRCINNRKPNMFALASTTLSHHQLNDECDGNQSAYRPLIRITPTEDERVEQFLHEEHIDNTHRPSCDILIKSKTTQTFDCRDECASEVDSYGSDSRVNSPSSDVNRRESIVSDIGSEPIQFECKQPENPNYDYNREDSSSSYKSNVRFERSQSRYSELEYIKGRDDWKDDYVRCDISEEIDSDNYHHLRRHSEAADTLEYIRGREDWIRNELHRGHQHSLPGIFEAGEPKMLIQDEIDSDEYHHNFFQHEMFRSNSESTKHETKIDDNFGEQFVANKTVGEHVTNDGIAVNLDDVDQQTSKWTHDESDEMNTNQQHSNGDIDVVIEDLITHDTINTDDIEITVFDLTPEPEKNNPFIFISEATDEQRETSTEICLNQSIGPQHQQPIEITISSDEHDINNNLAMDSTDTPSRNVTVNSNQSSINEFLCAEIQSETNTRQRCASESEKDIDFELNYGTLQPLDRNLRAKSESSGLLKPGQRPRRALSFENVDDLVRDVSSGPWLHL